MKYLLYLLAACLFVSGPVVNHQIQNTDGGIVVLLGMIGGIPAGYYFMKARNYRS